MVGPVPYISINIIKVNSFENASAINVGQNMGDGSQFVGTKSFVDDRDHLDSNSTFQSGQLPPDITGVKP